MSLKKKVKELLKGYRLEQYREARERGKFVEFWLVDADAPNTTSLTFKDLSRLCTLLGTNDLTVTGGNFDADERGDMRHTKVLVTAYAVKFPRARR